MSLPLLGLRALCDVASALVEHVSEHVIGDIGHADLHPGSADANGPDEELHLVLLPGKDSRS